jgi:hypothetical protein
MASSASARHHLFRTLENVLGDEDAATLMDHLPPGGWDDVATKADLREVRGEIAELRGDLKSDIAELRGELSEIRGHMVTRSELASLMDVHIDARMGAIARQWTFANVAMSATMLAAVIAAIRL